MVPAKNIYFWEVCGMEGWRDIQKTFCVMSGMKSILDLLLDINVKLKHHF